MTYSIIQKSQLEGQNRLDAEYYQPEYLNLSKSLRMAKSLSEIALIKSGTTPKDREDSLEVGPILFKTTDIRNNILSKDACYYHISEEIYNRMKATKILGRDVLINIVGATLGVIGRSAFVPSKFCDANITQAMALVRSKSQDYLPEYLFCFFLSKFGRFQADRIARPTGQYNLNLVELGSFQVPKINIKEQEKIKIFIDESLAQLNESSNNYITAEKILLEELGLIEFEVDHDLYSVVNLTEVKKVDRLDADYFQVKYKKLIDKLKNPKKLGDIAKRKDVKIKIDKEKEYKYTEISDVNVGNGEVLFNTIKGKDLPANAKMRINGGELIISKVRPTRGAIAIIPDGWKENHIASGAFSIFDVSSPTREYLQVVLRSIIGKLQMEQPTTGTSYPTIIDKDVEDILIPILSKQTQEKIAGLVRKSHESRKKAKDLLEEAKRKVEELIEK